MKKAIFPLILLLSLVLFWSCEEAPQTDDSITNADVSEEDLQEKSNESVEKVQDIFHSVPSPLDMASILKKAGATYDHKLLNPVKKVNEYSTSRQQALNLGVYGADLSYASIFNQNQESILYLSCTKKLADKLGMSKAFNDEVIERMEMNIDNRDSLLSIISDTYYNIDAYLKENNRDHISAMVIAAGWVEGLYLGTQIASNSKTPEPKLLQRIAEQKLSLENLKELVTSYNKGGELDDIMSDLEQIEQAYGMVSIDKEKTTVDVDDEGVTTFGGKTDAVISEKALIKLTAIVADIRKGYTEA
jgi:hypothetical protein